MKSSFGAGCLIEFAGLPGVGKSYLARQLVPRLSEYSRVYVPGALTNESRVLRVVIKIREVGRFAFLNPDAWFLLFKAFGGKFHLKLFFNWLFVLASISRVKGFDLAVLDQGILQAVWSCRYRHVELKEKPLSEAITRVCRRVALKRILVLHVLADSAQHSAWLRDRADGQSPIEGADDSMLENLSGTVAEAQSALERLDLSGSGHMTVQVMKYRNTADTSVRQLADILMDRIA